MTLVLKKKKEKKKTLKKKQAYLSRKLHLSRRLNGELICIQKLQMHPSSVQHFDRSSSTSLGQSMPNNYYLAGQSTVCAGYPCHRDGKENLSHINKMAAMPIHG